MSGCVGEADIEEGLVVVPGEVDSSCYRLEHVSWKELKVPQHSDTHTMLHDYITI